MTPRWRSRSTATPTSSTARPTSAICAGCNDVLAGIARRVGRRFLASIPALLGVVIVTFTLMRVLPGDPATFFASGPGAGREEIEEMRRTMGFDKPIPLHPVPYLGEIPTADFGRSMRIVEPTVLVSTLILRAFLLLPLSP